MKKLVPYTLATLLVASSSNAMMGANQENPVQNNPQSTTPNLELLSSEISEEINRIADNIEKNVVRALALPNSEAQKVYDDTFNKRKRLYELLKTSAILCRPSQVESIKNIFGVWLYNLAVWYMNRIPGDMELFSNSNLFDYLRNHLMTLADKEMAKYIYNKQIESESYKKGAHYISNIRVDVSNRVSADLKTIKFNAHWYETEGKNVDLNHPKFQGSMFDWNPNKSIRNWVEHSKACLEFLKQENIQ